MATLSQSSHAPRRAALVAIAAVCALGLAAGILLWAKVGTAVFFDMIAAGIAYCF
jgi:hypothetical protein